MKFRLSPKNLCMSDGMPFQQHHEAQIFGRDLNDVLTDELLLNVRSNIKVGDEIMVCGYADQTAGRLTQFARLRVYSAGKDSVKFVVDGEVTGIPYAEDEPVPEKPESRLEVVRAFHCFNVMDKSKNAVVESFKTKKEAENWLLSYDAAA